MDKTERWVEEEIAFDPVYQECATEYTLPDYLPDVRRVLTVRGKLMPGGQFMGGSTAEFAGVCQFSVLYADPEGKVASLTLPVDYRYTVNMGEVGEECKYYEDSRLENASCRLMGPRKMQLKGTVVSRVTRWTESEKEALSTDGEDLKFLEKTYTARRMYPFSTEEKSLTATLPVSGGSDCALLFYDGAVFVREITRAKDGILATGEIRLEAVCAGEDGVPFSLFSKIPFEEALPEEASPESFCMGKITSLDANVSEEGDGCQLLFDIGMRLFGHTAEQSEGRLVADVFSTAYPAEVTYGQETVWRHVKGETKYFTLDGSVERRDAEPSQMMTVAYTSVTHDSHAFTVEDNRLTLSANAHVSMLLSGGVGEEGVALQQQSFDYPLKMVFTLGETPPPDTKWEGTVTLSPAHGRLDQNKLFFEMEASASVWGSVKDSYRVVEEVTLDRDRPFENEGHQILACYLEDGDSLWSIAKRYHTSPESIALQNGLAEEALDHPDQPYTLDGYIRLLMTT